MEALTYIDGDWIAGNPPIMGPLTHAVWLGSLVFDGARYFDGVAPDLDRHAARVIRSAEAFALAPNKTAEEIAGIARDGIKRFPRDAALYIRPMMYAESGQHILVPDPATTRFVLSLIPTPMPEPTGFAACMSRTTRRPTTESAPTDAKAACLYPNGARAVREAGGRGYDNAVVLDGLGNVAEFATSNLFFAKDGVCTTPAINGTFLDGITRQRVIDLLRADGVTVVTRPVRPAELDTADEIFSTGNYAKVMPVTRYEGRDLQPGPIFARARALYMDFAHSR